MKLYDRHRYYIVRYWDNRASRTVTELMFGNEVKECLQRPNVTDAVVWLLETERLEKIKY